MGRIKAFTWDNTIPPQYTSAASMKEREKPVKTNKPKFLPICVCLHESCMKTQWLVVVLMTAEEKKETRRSVKQNKQANLPESKKTGDTMYRSPYLPHVKRALNHLSYIPWCSAWWLFVKIHSFLFGCSVPKFHAAGSGTHSASFFFLCAFIRFRIKLHVIDWKPIDFCVCFFNLYLQSHSNCCHVPVNVTGMMSRL